MLAALALLIVYEIRSRLARKSLLNSEAECVVCLTSHGRRIQRVHLAIESIARGRARPRRLVLWVDAEDYDMAVANKSIIRLKRRGLEVKRGQRQYRAHNKYFNYTLDPDPGVLVTADDDIFYPRHWLAELWASFEEGQRNDAIGFWVRLPMIQAGAFAPFGTWKDVTDRTRRIGAFTFGVSGVIFPNALRQALAAQGDKFVETTQLADDVWISWMALRSGIAVRQCRNKSEHYFVIPFTQGQRLADENVLNGQNDRQIRDTYQNVDRDQLELLASTWAATSPKQ